MIISPPPVIILGRGLPDRDHNREWQIMLTLLTYPGSMDIAVWNCVEKDPMDSSGFVSTWAM